MKIAKLFLSLLLLCFAAGSLARGLTIFNANTQDLASAFKAIGSKISTWTVKTN